MSTARSHNVQLQSEASDEDGDSGGEVEEWRRYPHSSSEKGKESVCPEVDKRIWGGWRLPKMRERCLKMYCSYALHAIGKQYVVHVISKMESILSIAVRTSQGAGGKGTLETKCPFLPSCLPTLTDIAP